MGVNTDIKLNTTLTLLLLLPRLKRALTDYELTTKKELGAALGTRTNAKLRSIFVANIKRIPLKEYDTTQDPNDHGKIERTDNGILNNDVSDCDDPCAGCEYRNWI